MRVEELTEYRTNLAEYLKLRMRAVAPNLTHMVREKTKKKRYIEKETVKRGDSSVKRQLEEYR